MKIFEIVEFFLAHVPEKFPFRKGIQPFPKLFSRFCSYASENSDKCNFPKISSFFGVGGRGGGRFPPFPSLGSTAVNIFLLCCEMKLIDFADPLFRCILRLFRFTDYF